MNKQITLKVTEIGINFLDRFRTNRRKNGIDNRDLSNGKLLEIIYTYFKNDEKKYQELLKLEYIKHV